MAYRHRDERYGLHHVVTRGNNKQRIVETDADRQLFMRTLKLVARKHGWTLYAYCLMDNHYHLVLHVGERGLSRGMCELNTRYAAQFNHVHGRINHLFGRRYWNEFLPDDRRVMNTVRYVVRNPKRAGYEGPLERHAWSSYAATIGLALSFAQLATGEVLGLFHREPRRAIERFVEFCDEDGLGGHVRWQPP